VGNYTTRTDFVQKSPLRPANKGKIVSFNFSAAGLPNWADILTRATTAGINSRHTISRFPGQAMPQPPLPPMPVFKTGTMG